LAFKGPKYVKRRSDSGTKIQDGCEKRFCPIKAVDKAKEAFDMGANTLMKAAGAQLVGGCTFNPSTQLHVFKKHS
jgi:hypothetical protein